MSSSSKVSKHNRIPAKTASPATPPSSPPSDFSKSKQPVPPLAPCGPATSQQTTPVAERGHRATDPPQAPPQQNITVEQGRQVVEFLKILVGLQAASNPSLSAASTSQATSTADSTPAPRGSKLEVKDIQEVCVVLFSSALSRSIDCAQLGPCNIYLQDSGITSHCRSDRFRHLCIRRSHPHWQVSRHTSSACDLTWYQSRTIRDRSSTSMLNHQVCEISCELC